MLAHRLLGGCNSSLSISCPSLGSTLIAAARALLWSSFRRCSESPLLAHPETMVSCLLGRSRLFPDSLPASCGTLAPFRLCSRSQPQSSPWDPTSKARASAPSPCPSWEVSRQASQASECWSALILCAGISLLCPLHPCCCPLLRGFEASSPTATCSLRPRRGFLVCGNLSSFTALSQWCRYHSLFFYLCFFFFLLPYPGTWGVSCLWGGVTSSASVQ